MARRWSSRTHISHGRLGMRQGTAIALLVSFSFWLVVFALLWPRRS